jgi:hypothetical protein
LQQYLRGEVSLRKLIADLEGLLEALESFEETWKDAFRSDWGSLEQVYACSRPDSGVLPSTEDQKILSEAVDKLLRLVRKVQT